MAHTSYGDDPHNSHFLKTARFARNFCEMLDTEPRFQSLPEVVAARLRASATRFAGLAEGLAQKEVEERPKDAQLRLAEAIGNFAQELKTAGFAHESNAVQVIANVAMEYAKKSPDDISPKGHGL